MAARAICLRLWYFHLLFVTGRHNSKSMDSGTVRKFLLDKGMAYLFALFIAGYFLLPMAAGHRRFYYILVFPAVLLLWREILNTYRHNTLSALLLAYTAYMMCTLAWTENFNATQAFREIWYSFTLLSFCFVSGYLVTRQWSLLDRLARYSVWLATAAALVSVVAWYMNHPFPESRLAPLGVMNQPAQAACVYGVFLLLSVHYLNDRKDHAGSLIQLIPCIFLLSLILFTQSRTPLAAACLGLLVLVGPRALGVIAVAVAISWALLWANSDLWHARVETLSFRPGIWQQVIADMEGHWWFGHGYLVSPEVAAYDSVFNHAHSGYLASLRDGGVVGLALLLVMLGVALLWSWRLYSEKGNRILLALLLYAMTCIAPDYDRLLVHPNETWLFFWLPVALIMAAYPGNRA